MAFSKHLYANVGETFSVLCGRGNALADGFKAE